MIDFKKCTDKAYEILLSQNIEFGVPIKATELELEYPIIFDSLQEYSKITGYSMDQLTANKKAKNGCIYKSNGYFIVLHNEMDCKERRNFTDGHEIGHIVCGHKFDDPASEVEANFFSSQLFMPNPLIKHLAMRIEKHSLKVNNVILREIFDVSDEAARKKIRTLNKYFQNHRWDNDLIMKYKNSLDYRISIMNTLQ